MRMWDIENVYSCDAVSIPLPTCKMAVDSEVIFFDLLLLYALWMFATDGVSRQRFYRMCTYLPRPAQNTTGPLLL